jgi:peptidoglycan/LPS O-acetylase OafA/YrhL
VSAVLSRSPPVVMPRLGALAHGRDNNFQLIRLLAGSFVVLFHSYALTGRWTHEPLWRLAPELNFGALGVKCFFVMSGFLVTQSWLARNALWCSSSLPFPGMHSSSRRSP